MKLKYWLLLLVLCGTYLALKGLDNNYFWDDESEGAIFAKNYLNTGKFTAWDGRNLYSFRNGKILDENLNTRHPPMDILLCAVSFKLFGINTWTARFPFVLIGLISLWVFFLLVKQDFGQEDWLWLFMIGGLALSTQFILNIRSCRYYSLSILFSLLTYYGYRRYLSDKQIKFFLLVVLASVASFYTNPMICAGFLAAIAVVHLIFNWKSFTAKDWKIVAAMSGLFLLLTIPYVLYSKIWIRPDLDYGVKELWLYRRLILIGWNLSSINFMTCFPWPMVIGLTLFILHYDTLPVSKTTLQWIVLAISHIIFIALLSPQPTYFDAKADTRYLVAAIPFLVGLAGIFIWYVSRWNKLLGLLLFVIYLTSNVLTLNPVSLGGSRLTIYLARSLPLIIGLVGVFLWVTKRWIKSVFISIVVIYLTTNIVILYHNEYEFKWLLPGLVKEVHHEFPTALWAVSQYLAEHANQDDKVSCYPDYNDFPLMFYLGNKIKISGALDKKTPIPMSSLKGINAPLFIEENFPEWIFCFGYDPDMKTVLDFLSRPHLDKGTTTQYQYKLETILEYYWFESNRPEIQFHTFGPKEKFNIHSEATYVFKKYPLDLSASSGNKSTLSNPAIKPGYGIFYEPGNK